MIMDAEKKIDAAKYVMSRFDSYYNGINTKGSFYLTLNTFIIGSVVSGYVFLDGKNQFSNTIIGLLAILVMAAFASMFFALYAVNPFLKSGNSTKYLSLIFFGSIASMKEKEFCDEFDKLTSEKLYSDFRSQVYQLAVGLNIKFSLMRWVGRFLLLEFLIITIVVISILTK